MTTTSDGCMWVLDFPNLKVKYFTLNTEHDSDTVLEALKLNVNIKHWDFTRLLTPPYKEN